MKISDDVLLYKTWLTQLRKLSKSVTIQYIGGGFGVRSQKESEYLYASSIHIVERKCITDKIGTQQLRKRLISLIDEGFMVWSYRNLTFMIDTEQAKEAYEAARQFMLSKGIAGGWDDHKKCMRTSQVDDFESLTLECYQHLLEGFKQPNWEQIYPAYNMKEEASNAN